MAVPPALERVVRTCLSKDPGQRFQTALELKRALAWAFEQPAVASRPQRSMVDRNCRCRRNWRARRLGCLAISASGNPGTRAAIRHRAARQRTIHHRRGFGRDRAVSRRTNRGFCRHAGRTKRLVGTHAGRHRGAAAVRNRGRVLAVLVARQQVHRVFRRRQAAPHRSHRAHGHSHLRYTLVRAAAARGPTTDVFCSLRSPLASSQVPASGGTPSPLTKFDASQWRCRALLAAGAARRKLLVPGAKRQAGWQRRVCGLARQSEPSRSSDYHRHQRHLRIGLFAMDARHNADGAAVRSEEAEADGRGGAGGRPGWKIRHYGTDERGRVQQWAAALLRQRFEPAHLAGCNRQAVGDPGRTQRLRHLPHLSGWAPGGCGYWKSHAGRSMAAGRGAQRLQPFHIHRRRPFGSGMVAGRPHDCVSLAQRDFSQGFQRRRRRAARHAIGYAAISHGLVAQRADDPVQPVLSWDRNRSLGSSRDSGRQSHGPAASLLAHAIQRTGRPVFTRNESTLGGLHVQRIRTVRSVRASVSGSAR